jgi:hypothetical protein
VDGKNRAIVHGEQQKLGAPVYSVKARAQDVSFEVLSRHWQTQLFIAAGNGNNLPAGEVVLKAAPDNFYFREFWHDRSSLLCHVTKQISRFQSFKRSPVENFYFLLQYVLGIKKLRNKHEALRNISVIYP